jgi:hypothetical protein
VNAIARRRARRRLKKRLTILLVLVLLAALGFLLPYLWTLMTADPRSPGDLGRPLGASRASAAIAA